MIRYDIQPPGLLAEIAALVPNWLKRAGDRRAKFIKARRYQEKKGIWSEIKSVFMKIQHNKCIFCERQLAGLDHGGAIEHDLEHFRPKSSVRRWPPPGGGDDDGLLNYGYATGKPLARGYYWLAYEPDNYTISCKKCNSPLKDNYFPIAKARGRVPATPLQLAAEEPFLVFALGTSDANPANLITFNGITAIPVKKNGADWRRARVMIDFFKLNVREELLRDRANQLIRLANALTVLETRGVTDAKKRLAANDVERLLKPSSPHCNCVTAAYALYRDKRTQAKAWEVFQKADKYLRSLS